MAKIWATLFAQAGDKQAIPVPVEADGTVSVTQGWTPDYELPNTDPSYKPVGREEMNGVLNEVTDSIKQLQLQGAAEWSALLGAYPKGAMVIHAGERWISSVAGNVSTPGASSTWINSLLSSLPAGTRISYTGTSAPTGYLACPLTPTNISRTTYAALFAAIGTTWGAGDGSTTFGMPYYPADYVGVRANANVGTSTVGENLAHVHAMNVGNVGASAAGSGTLTAFGVALNTGSSGGAANLAAGIRELFCVKY